MNCVQKSIQGCKSIEPNLNKHHEEILKIAQTIR